MAKEEKNIEALEAELAQLKEQLAAKEAAEQTLLDSNEELQQQLASSEKTLEAVKVIVTHDKAKYEVIVPRVQLDGKVYDAKDLKTNKEVVKALVEKGSGVLKAL